MNKQFLKVGVFSLFMLFASNKVNAQSQQVQEVAGYITQQMSYLNMTPTQAQQVFQINLQAANAVEVLDEKSLTLNASQSENFEGLAKILHQRNVSLQEVLSPTQFQVFKENKIAKAATFRTILMANMLDLTQDQLQPVYNINQTVVESVRQNLDAYFTADKESSKNKAQRKLHKELKKSDKAFDKVLSPQQTILYHENADFLRTILREEYGAKN